MPKKTSNVIIFVNHLENNYIPTVIVFLRSEVLSLIFNGVQIKAKVIQSESLRGMLHFKCTTEENTFLSISLFSP